MPWGTRGGVMGIQPMADVDLIRHAYVLPERQGQGVGTELLRHLRGTTGAAHPRGHMGGRRVGDPVLHPQWLSAGVTRAQDDAAPDVLGHPRAAGRDLRRPRRPAVRGLSSRREPHMGVDGQSGHTSVRSASQVGRIIGDPVGRSTECSLRGRWMSRLVRSLLVLSLIVTAWERHPPPRSRPRRSGS